MKSKKIYTDIIHIPMVIKVGEGISTSCVMDDSRTNTRVYRFKKL